MTTATQPGRRNDSALFEYGADRATLYDAQDEIEGIKNDLETLIRRLDAAAQVHGYVREQCRDTAQVLRDVLHDEIDGGALAILENALHPQGRILK